LKQVNNEKGAVLVVSLVILGLLMIIGTSITMTSSIELNIARNEKVAQGAFYEAENARILASKIIRSVFSGSSYSDGDEYETGSDVWALDGDFPHEAIDDPDTRAGTPDVRLGTAGSPQAFVDVDKDRVGPLPGGSAEFAAGYEGSGKAGSMQVIYVMDSEGREAPNAVSRVQVEYRMLP
jgi:hypothetical protein